MRPQTILRYGVAPGKCLRNSVNGYWLSSVEKSVNTRTGTDSRSTPLAVNPLSPARLGSTLVCQLLLQHRLELVGVVAVGRVVGAGVDARRLAVQLAAQVAHRRLLAHDRLPRPVA